MSIVCYSPLSQLHKLERYPSLKKFYWGKEKIRELY